MSLPVHIETPSLEAIDSAAARLLNERLISLEPIGGGRNSRVYRLETVSRLQYALKAYFRHNTDARDRLGTEFESLRFMWDHGLRDIPRPILMDRQAGVAIYEYIEGRIASAAPSCTELDVEEAVRFLARLESIKGAAGSQSLPVASEACFSIRAIVENIRGRLQRLLEVNEKSEPYACLYEFLDNDLMPGFHGVADWCRARMDEARIHYESELGEAERTLSPSDFGFHNALRRSDGRLIFVDFEYFGWDDPAKMTVDFLLHPAMSLSLSLKRRFVSGILKHFAVLPHLAERLEIVYPLFAIKWCLILLNEFLPEHLLRRQFAHNRPDAAGFERQAVQKAQLAKATHLWQTVRGEYEHFPYLG